ncbi:MAG: hypothetical protein ABI831_01690 [Betaproteobacteria bacterium]
MPYSGEVDAFLHLPPSRRERAGTDGKEPEAQRLALCRRFLDGERNSGADDGNDWQQAA